MGTKSDENGITVFEISIILLIVFLITLSSVLIIRKINKAEQRYDQTYIPSVDIKGVNSEQ